jgi:iron complex transport system substrate-binding protein
MKKIIAAAVATAALMSFQATAFMEGPQVSIIVDGAPLQCETAPFIENDRTLVPMRAIFEAVGADVQWDQDTSTVVAWRVDEGTPTFVSLQADQKTAFVNDQEKELDVPAKIVGEGTTMVPLRFVVESLGETVEWDQDSYTVTVTTK